MVRGNCITIFLVLLLIIFFTTSNSVKGQESPSNTEFIGSWKATQQMGKIRTRVFFHIKPEEESTFSGSFDMPAQRMNHIPLSDITIKGDTLTFKVRGIGIPFKGTANEDGSVVKGRLGPRQLTFTPLNVSMDSAKLDNPFMDSFHGITSDGSLNENLFSIKKTGVSTAPIVEAADQFLETLNTSQREKATFPISSNEWRHWTNSPYLKRRGVSLDEMTEQQRGAAFSLMKAGLSAKGFNLSRDIMRIEDYVANLTGNHRMTGEFLYHITIMGNPSNDKPWGWQLDGHHLVINYFVLGDQVVMTPTFFGSEPVAVDTGRYAGTAGLQGEQNRGMAFMNSLQKDQQEIAQTGTTKNEDKLQSAPFRDNAEVKYKGINASKLNSSQRDSLLDLIHLYVSNMKEGQARVRMEQVKKHLDETHFAWIGEVSSDAVFYYRIQSPVILIEFDHAEPRTLPGVKQKTPYRNHIHTIVRTPNGNDYGKNLLKQHYQKHKDNPNHNHHR